jgi:7,8-dihydropterin-6-yl-methyl-4-(beta-D-ribofuranosyl)aminobenzene 5'-phosphate synthase
MKRFLLTLLLILIAIILFTTLFFTGRQVWANRQVARDWREMPQSPPLIQTTSTLEILPLYEETAVNNSLISGHGVAYLIRTDTAVILMDAGNNPELSQIQPLIENMQVLGVTWEQIDSVVISHPHPDHVGGVQAWKDKTVSFGNYSGIPNDLVIYTPIPMTIDYSSAVYASEPVSLTADIATSGVISYTEVYPMSLYNAIGFEQALIVNVEDAGLVIITGCGHPSIERLVLRAEQLYGQPVIGIVGGLHYETEDFSEIQPHIEFLKSHNLMLIAPSPHDSTSTSLNSIQANFPDIFQELAIGKTIYFP